MHGAVPPLRSSHLNKFQYLRSPQILKFSTAAFYAFFSASPLFSTHPVYSALARWSRLAISALVLPLFLLCSFHQKSFFLTVLVFVCLSLSGTHSHTHTPLFLSVYILYVVEADCLCNWVILLFTGLMH